MEAKNTGELIAALLHTVFSGVALAMGVAVAALQILGQLKADSAFTMLGIGLACLAANSLSGSNH